MGNEHRHGGGWAPPATSQSSVPPIHEGCLSIIQHASHQRPLDGTVHQVQNGWTSMSGDLEYLHQHTTAETYAPPPISHGSLTYSSRPSHASPDSTAHHPAIPAAQANDASLSWHETTSTGGGQLEAQPASSSIYQNLYSTYHHHPQQQQQQQQQQQYHQQQQQYLQHHQMPSSLAGKPNIPTAVPPPWHQSPATQANAPPMPTTISTSHTEPLPPPHPPTHILPSASSSGNVAPEPTLTTPPSPPHPHPALHVQDASEPCALSHPARTLRLRTAGPSVPSTSPPSTKPATAVIVWDLDETLIIFNSLLTGHYSRANPGIKQQEAQTLGELWQDCILNLLDNHLHYQQLEPLDICHVADVIPPHSQPSTANVPHSAPREQPDSISTSPPPAKRHKPDSQQPATGHTVQAGGMAALSPNSDQETPELRSAAAMSCSAAAKAQGAAASAPPGSLGAVATATNAITCSSGSSSQAACAAADATGSRTEATASASPASPSVGRPGASSQPVTVQHPGCKHRLIEGSKLSAEAVTLLMVCVFETYTLAASSPVPAGLSAQPSVAASTGAQKWMEEAHKLHLATDKLTGGWLTAAAGLINEVSDAAMCQMGDVEVRHVLVTTGQLVATLGKLLLFRLAPFFPVEAVYSASKESKAKCFERIRCKFGNSSRYCVIGDGLEEERAASAVAWPYIRVILGLHPTSSRASAAQNRGDDSLGAVGHRLPLLKAEQILQLLMRTPGNI